jgi:hypothetical protein
VFDAGCEAGPYDDFKKVTTSIGITVVSAMQGFCPGLAVEPKIQ